MMGLELVIPLAKIVGRVSIDAARVTEFNMDILKFKCLYEIIIKLEVLGV